MSQTLQPNNIFFPSGHSKSALSGDPTSISSVHPSKEGAPVVAQVGVTSGSGGDPSSFGVVSPYRMNPSYLRPRPIGGAESSDDHGYSTMTPMSEVLLPIHHANADVVNGKLLVYSH